MIFLGWEKTCYCDTNKARDNVKKVIKKREKSYCRLRRGGNVKKSGRGGKSYRKSERSGGRKVGTLKSACFRRSKFHSKWMKQFSG